MHSVSSSKTPEGRIGRLRRCLPLRILGWLSVPFFPLFCLFVMDYMNFDGHAMLVFSFWRERSGPALFEALVVLILFSGLTLLLRRLSRSALIFGILSLICAYVNYTKTALNGDHFYPQDLTMLSQARELVSFISGDLPRWFWLGAAAILLWIAFFYFVPIALPGSFLWRWSAAALLAVAIYPSICTLDRVDLLLSRFDMTTADAGLQSANYTANGFVGAFTVNLFNMNIRPPAGYSQESILAFLEGYEAVSAAPETEPFDVVVVLSESFFDPRILPGLSLSENPLENYDRLRALPNCYSGSIYTTAMGGGTVRPEFNILTGLTVDYLGTIATPYLYVSRAFPTYVSNYKDAGYTALAVHPYLKSFYSRESAYPLIGFDEFYGQEEVEAMVEAQYKRGYVSDATTSQVIRLLVDGQEDPTFLFAITMENHQPFSALDPSEIRIQVDCPALSEASHTALTTYVQGLYDADQMLGELAAWVDSRERPTVLVFFGDHLPTLGNSAYNETGYVNTLDGFSSEERQKLYSTPFVIYSNRELSGGLLEEHTGNHISDYNLLNTVARSTGMARTPYMELLADFYRTAPFYNVRLELPLTDEMSFFTQAMEQITYDRLLGQGWSN